MADTRKDWTEREPVRLAIDRASEYVAARQAREFIESMYATLKYPFDPVPESPLEAIFVVWWHAAVFGLEHAQGGRFALNLQQEVTAGGSAYRLDFVLALRKDQDAQRFAAAGQPFPQIAIEVDGHGFHEKTRAQVAYRNQRDRALSQAGWTVLHYSWSEVVENGARCIDEVVDLGMTALMECDRAAARHWADQHPEEVERVKRMYMTTNDGADSDH